MVRYDVQLPIRSMVTGKRAAVTIQFAGPCLPPSGTDIVLFTHDVPGGPPEPVFARVTGYMLNLNSDPIEKDFTVVCEDEVAVNMTIREALGLLRENNLEPTCLVPVEEPRDSAVSS